MTHRMYGVQPPPRRMTFYERRRYAEHPTHGIEMRDLAEASTSTATLNIPEDTKIRFRYPPMSEKTKRMRIERQYMSRYKHTALDDESTSTGSVQLNEETPSTSSIQIEYRQGLRLWRLRNNLEKILLVFTALLIIIVTILSIIIFLLCKKDSPETSKEGKVCLLPRCVKSAADMISSMDPTANPCEDFYQYACGGWVNENPVPDGKSIWGTFGKLELQNQLVIKRILENPKTEFKSEAEKKAKLYYESCMDPNDRIEQLGAQPMWDVLQDIGGWNISGDFSLKTWSLQELVQVLHNEYNMGGLFSWAVGEDDKNSSQYVIQIDQGGLTLPARENYLNKTANKNVLDAYLEYMTKVGVLLGGEPSSTRAQMSAVIEFETKLAYITQPEEDMRDEMKLYHLMPLAELQERAPFISWQEYFETALVKINRRIAPTEMVVVHAPEYLEKLSALVEEYVKTDNGKIVINNYMVWQTVRSLSCCLPKAFRDAHKGLRKALMGSEGGEEPWQSCVTDTNNVIGFAIGAMFVRQVFDGNSKKVAEGMINDIRNAFLENLKNLPWMDETTRAAAISKANAITDMIGFPEFIMDPAQLDEKYNDLEIRGDEYFMNNIRVNQYNLRKNIERLDKPVNKTRWDMTPSTANAYYTPTKNQIVFPAGILRYPFYDVQHSSSLNYGSMGVVMGHELTHAFDDLGREYDQYGNLHNWWRNDTIERFKEKARCVVDQYSRYTINGHHLNGKQTLGENIADNGGLKAAFHAYQRKVAFSVPLPLPGLNLTHKQLFFLSFAQVWCSSSTPEATLLQIEKDPHAPSKFRVIGPLSNLEEFSREFNCPLGSKMNPKDKCNIW